MQSQVKYIDRGVEQSGTFKVDGWMLELTCAHGTCRVPLGLYEPKVLARKLLRVLAAKAERLAVERAIAAATPPAATIEAAKAALPPAARRAAAAPPALPG